jgi:hypothetical protein
MKSDRLTDAEIRAEGWDALVKRLGPSGAIRFTIQTQQGHGDYAARRHRLAGALSVDQLMAQLRTARTAERRKRRNRSS